MEIITELVKNQLTLVLPVGLVIVGCILLFTYSIRPAKQPPFLSGLDDRKTAGKKKKLKEKKSPANGHVTTSAPKPDKSPAKEQKKSPEPKKEKKVEPVVKETKKSEVSKKPSEPQESKKKSNKKFLEKPADFDEGNWETVPSKSEKKKKVEQTPTKKDKKNKVQSEVQAAVKQENVEKEEENPVVKAEPEAEPEPEPVIEEIVEENVEEPALVVEEKKDKKKKKKASKVLQPEEEPAEFAPEVQASSKAEPVPSTPVVAFAKEPKNTPIDTPRSVPAPSGAAFDELGDTWTEAKPVKKSKKKARRDN